MSQNKSDFSTEMDDEQNYDPKFTKELLLHIDNLFHQRVNIFLIAEAIFFAAFATVWDATFKIVQILLCSAALVFTLSLWYALLRLNKGLSWLAEKYTILETSGLYRDYRHLGHRGLGANTLVFTWLLPLVTAVFWVLLLLAVVGVFG